ncbi:putative MFS family arabinose efflux permease [Comamonas sp. BIGb0124]|uniref:arabinose transporter n=1 Tax=Comamonas sp. BIGb0124 TaxID=2485130 RepID=UPI000F4A5A5E|nr:arabinose transporter [Comamonas sp. BIGb0124]ROR17923.1 putative MFS family arabinose efflux permease [Comamonas sp. BIGb0124]
MPLTRVPRSSSQRSLLSLTCCVFSVFLVTGAALPALPLHIHDGLGLSTFAVGLVSGAQFAAALLCRLWSGKISDERGPKFAVTVGLIMASLAGLLYVVSMYFTHDVGAAIAILILGRVLLGGAESFVMIGAQSWCLALSGTGSVGKMLAWIGTAMFVAMAVGAPLGSYLFASFGFASIGVLTCGGALLVLPLIAPMQAIKPVRRAEADIRRVLRAVWVPGGAMAFSSVGYGIVTAFAVLLFAQRGWQPAWLSFTAFAAALMLARVCFGSLPDRLGGARTASIFIVIHGAGLGLIWIAPFAWLGFAGAALAGFGYALVYPGLGIEAVARAPARSRGLAMGVYTAFIDIALGVLAPLLGLIANLLGLGAIFLIAAILSLCAVPVAVWLQRHPAGESSP